MDVTLIQAWAGHKSFVCKDGNDDGGETASELRYTGHTLIDNRQGLVVNAMVTQADGLAFEQQKRLAAPASFDGSRNRTHGHKTASFVDR